MRAQEKGAQAKRRAEKIMATKTGEKGLLIVNTGSGKGKTSAALGMVFRHIGTVILLRCLQFTKSPAWDTGEAKVLAKIPELVTLHIWRRLYLGNPGPRTRHLRRRQGLERAKELDPRRPPPHGVARRGLNIVLRYDYSIFTKCLLSCARKSPPTSTSSSNRPQMPSRS